MVLENLAIDLAGARQPIRMDLLSQLRQRLPRQLDPAGPGFGRDILQAVIEAVIAEPRRLQGPQAEELLEVRLEEGVQFVVFRMAGW